MFYIEVNKRFLAESRELLGTLEDLSQGSDEKEYSVVFLTNREKEMVDYLREKEISYTVVDRDAGGGVTSPDTY